MRQGADVTSSFSTGRLVAAAILTLGIAAAGAAEPEPVWNQWRGPAGQGIAADDKLPTEWSTTTNVLWSTPVPGRGFSSPIVWHDTIFMTTSIEGDVVPDVKTAPHVLGGEPFVHPDAVSGDRRHTLKVMALNRTSGKLLWERTAYEGPVFDARHKAGSFANTTPATDGRLVFAWFGSEGLYAYDFSGKLAWKKSFGGIPAFGMGTGSSPVLFEDLLILQCDEDNGGNSFIVALDRRTGKEVWRTARPVQGSWTTPVIATSGTHTELVASGNEFIIGYNPRTGQELWRCKGTGGWTVPTPVAAHGIVVASAAHPLKRAVAIKLGGRGDITDTAQVAWVRDKGTGYTPSSLAYGDFMYLLTDGGLLTCIDIRTGEVKYEGARPSKPARFSGSPIAFGGKILLTSDEGDTYVLAAGPKHEILRTNSLDEPTYASPAAAAGVLYIRTATKLYAIGAKP
jgi:outer membrane protein assembly factor BamB